MSDALTPAETAVTGALRLAAHVAGDADMDVPLTEFLSAGRAAIDALTPIVAAATLRHLAETESICLSTGRSMADAVLVTDIERLATELEADE